MTEAVQAQDLVTVTIDGTEVAVPKGTLVIRAAEEVGCAIPRFCDHPLLDPVGACRQCLVEITDAGNGRGFPMPQASCTTVAAQGMRVKTAATSDRARAAQRGIVELLLINHPLDCPTCDKGGECPLQNQAVANGTLKSRYDGVKRSYPKPKRLSPQLLLDRERCVLCTRCTRFADQIAGDDQLALSERGAKAQITVYDGRPFTSYFSGNVVQICPVGALTSDAYRFSARPFDLVSTVTTCEGCAAGCQVRTDHRRGQVKRRQAGDLPEVNEEWTCDRGRFGFVSGRGADRVTTPLVRRDGELVEASWPEALDAAVAGLKAAGSATGVLTGGRLTREVAARYAALARDTLGTEDIDCRARAISAEETEFLWRLAQTHPRPGAASAAGAGEPGIDAPGSTPVTCSASGAGAGRLGSDDPGPAPVTYSESGAGRSGSGDPGLVPVTYSDLEAAGHVVLVGFEPEDEAPIVFLRLRKANRKNKVKVTVIAPYLSVGSAKLNATLIPTAPGTEAAALAALDLDEGTVVLGGERLATSPGALQALAQTSEKGARWAWIPRRPGEIGALQAGAFPRPTGRAADAIVAACNSGDLKALVVGGVELADLPDPKAAQAALRTAFTVSLEQRLSDAAELADVVLPVTLLEETSGTFVNWEWRDCPVAQVVTRPASPMTEIRVLKALAEALAQAPGGSAAFGHGAGIGARDIVSGGSAAPGPGAGNGARDIAPGGPAVPVPGVPSGAKDLLPGVLNGAGDLASGAGPLAEALDDPAASAGIILAAHRELLDDARLTDGEPALIASARPVVARVNGRTAQTLGLADAARVTLNGVPFDLVVDDTVVDGVVWAPARARGHDLAAAGLVVGRPVALAKEAAA